MIETQVQLRLTADRVRESLAQVNVKIHENADTITRSGAHNPERMQERIETLGTHVAEQLEQNPEFDAIAFLGRELKRSEKGVDTQAPMGILIRMLAEELGISSQVSAAARSGSALGRG